MGEQLIRMGSWVLGGMGAGVTAAGLVDPLGGLFTAMPLVAGSVLIMAGWCGLSLTQIWRPVAH